MLQMIMKTETASLLILLSEAGQKASLMPLPRLQLLIKFSQAPHTPLTT
ncbi:MAG: hypothetical protein LM561_02500 [Desulfurococcaceae archaeon]|nr:hypothetical protein [Desulfurococcaceae archaeon]